MEIYKEFINGHLFQPYNDPDLNKIYHEIILPDDSYDEMIQKFNTWYDRAYEGAKTYEDKVSYIGKGLDKLLKTAYDINKFTSLITNFIRKKKELLNDKDLVKNEFIQNMLNKLKILNLTSLLEPDLLE